MHPSLAGLARLWTTDYWQGIDEHGTVAPLADDRNLFRPITIATLWLNGWLGVHPARFRAVNALLHAGAAWTVGRLSAHWAGAAAGVVASLVVLAHPVATDVVNRVVGRADILVLLGIAGFLVVQRAARRDRWTLGRTAAGAGFAAVAFGAKESGLALVPIAIVHAWLGGREQEAAGGEHPPRVGAVARDRWTWPELLALAAPLALYLIARSVAVGLPRYARDPAWDLIGNPVWGTSIAARLPAAAALAWAYTRLLLWPWPLLAFNVPRALPTWTDAAPWLGVLVVAVLTLTLWRTVRSPAARGAVLGLAAAWWLACFVPVAQVLAPIGAYFEVRFAYPFLGAVALVAAVAAERIAHAGPRVRLGALALLGAAIVAAATLITVRNRDFRTLEALLRADLRSHPADPAILLRLAEVLDEANRSTEAQAAYERVLALAPSSSQAAYELGDFEVRHGRVATGKQHLEQAVALDPSHRLALLRLGNMALDAAQLQVASQWLSRAAAAAPDDPFVLYALAVLDDARGDAAGAIAKLESLVARRPDFTLAVRGLAQLRQAHPSARPRP